MPIDASGYPTPPQDVAALGRRLVQLERIAELTGGSRTLTSASIGKGGLRVIKDGDIRIEGTGSLIIQTGNLVLGAGKIDGAALKSQLEPAYKTATASNLSLSTSWATKVSLTLTAPSWATSAVVQAYGVGNLKNNDSSANFNWNGGIRVQVAGDTSLDPALGSGNTDNYDGQLLPRNRLSVLRFDGGHLDVEEHRGEPPGLRLRGGHLPDQLELAHGPLRGRAVLPVGAPWLTSRATRSRRTPPRSRGGWRRWSGSSP